MPLGVDCLAQCSGERSLAQGHPNEGRIKSAWSALRACAGWEFVPGLTGRGPLLRETAAMLGALVAGARWREPRLGELSSRAPAPSGPGPSDWLSALKRRSLAGGPGGGSPAMPGPAGWPRPCWRYGVLVFASLRPAVCCRAELVLLRIGSGPVAR